MSDVVVVLEGEGGYVDEWRSINVRCVGCDRRDALENCAVREVQGDRACESASVRRAGRLRRAWR